MWSHLANENMKDCLFVHFLSWTLSYVYTLIIGNIQATIVFSTFFLQSAIGSQKTIHDLNWIYNIFRFTLKKYNPTSFNAISDQKKRFSNVWSFGQQVMSWQQQKNVDCSKRPFISSSLLQLLFAPKMSKFFLRNNFLETNRD